MFPNGVIYEGVSDEPFSFRGESGANDSMVMSVSFTRQTPALRFWLRGNLVLMLCRSWRLIAIPDSALRQSPTDSDA